MHKSSAVAIALLSAYTGASPVASLQERQACPNVHIFGARETTAPAGYGTAGVVVNLVLAAYPGSTAEAIVYPACGGQASCGGASYGSSVATGTAAIANTVNAYAAKCPSTQLVIVGYSQGGEISDNAVCGGNDTPQGVTSTSANTLNAAAQAQVKAVIEMGSPRRVQGSSYNVGTCTAGGFSARPAGYNCPQAAKLRSYCDAADPYCCTGNDANTHQGYGTEYGQAALTFIKSKLSASGSTAPPATTAAGAAPVQTTAVAVAPAPVSGGGSVAKYGQCGGIGYSGATSCAAGSTCKVYSTYYSQCL